MTKRQIESILRLHRKWLMGDKGGKKADFSRANLCGANLDGASLDGASLYGANLDGALNIDKTADSSFALAMRCPQKGSFTAFKKASGKIVELFVPGSAKRSSATGNKCRCSEAKVVAIYEKDGKKSESESVASERDSSFIYEIGKEISVADFDENRWNECSTGIHFFMSFEEARDY